MKTNVGTLQLIFGSLFLIIVAAASVFILVGCAIIGFQQMQFQFVGLIVGAGVGLYILVIIWMNVLFLMGSENQPKRHRKVAIVVLLVSLIGVYQCWVPHPSQEQMVALMVGAFLALMLLTYILIPLWNEKEVEKPHVHHCRCTECGEEC